MLAGVLTICLLFLTACAPKPLTQPPDYALVSTAEIQLQQGKIISSNIFSVYYGKEKAEYYRYILENGVAQLREDPADSEVRFYALTYGRFSDLLEDVLEQLKKDGLGMSDSEHGDPEILYTSVTAKTVMTKEPNTVSGSLRYMGYYVYSLEKRTLVKGDQILVGREDLGALRISNQWFGSLNGTIEFVYVLIAD
jgi:hypothetical protein